jgi:anaerobic ribonucleoside-triphosphate reductase activating protein
MRIAKIEESLVAGPGRRTCIWTAGCSGPFGRAGIEVREDGSHDGHCVGCQASKLWFKMGHEWGRMRIADYITIAGLDVTFMGGEPFEQSDLLEICSMVKRMNPGVHIIVYSGIYWEDILNDTPLCETPMLACIDVIVDGPYRKHLDDSTIQWRGSRNQRVIDVPASLEAGHAVELNWDNPTFVVTPEGDVISASGNGGMMEGLGESERAPRCGEVGRI